MVKADSHVVKDDLSRETHETVALVFSKAHVNRMSLGRDLWPVISTQA